jgi:hypothetical protein
MELRMVEHTVGGIIYLLTLREVVVKTKMTTHGKRHGEEKRK